MADGGTAPFPASLGILKIFNYFNFDRQNFYFKAYKKNLMTFTYILTCCIHCMLVMFEYEVLSDVRFDLGCAPDLRQFNFKTWISLGERGKERMPLTPSISNTIGYLAGT